MRSLRAALGAGLLLFLMTSCGLVHHDVTVEEPFQAGGGPPTATVNIDSTRLTAPLAASAGDLSKLSSVTMQSVRLSATDAGDVSFVASLVMTLSANGLSEVQLATLPAQPKAGQQEVALQVDGRDLKAYLAAGGTIMAKISYSPVPVSARGLKLILVVRGSL